MIRRFSFLWSTIYSISACLAVLAHNTNPCGPGGKLTEQYALVAEQDGWYPVFKRGAKNPIGEMYLKKGEIWKIGITKNPSRRYSQSYLKNMHLRYETRYNGTRNNGLMREKSELKGYINEKGFLPSGN